jgi:hypothetical protein
MDALALGEAQAASLGIDIEPHAALPSLASDWRSARPPR